MISCEVVVAGGGSAGLSAAIAAARAGAETLLIERGGMLGGMGSSAFVHTICGLYEIRDAPGAIFANEGFPPEFAKRLIGCGRGKSGSSDGPPRCLAARSGHVCRGRGSTRIGDAEPSRVAAYGIDRREREAGSPGGRRTHLPRPPRVCLGRGFHRCDGRCFARRARGHGFLAM